MSLAQKGGIEGVIPTGLAQRMERFLANINISGGPDSVKENSRLGFADHIRTSVRATRIVTLDGYL